MVSDRELQGSARSISARAWCSVPDLGTGKALVGPRQHGLQATATTSAGHRGIALELEQGPRSLCIDAGQINLRFYPSRG